MSVQRKARRGRGDRSAGLSNTVMLDHTPVSARLQPEHHTDLSRADRRTLHELLCALHRAIHRGRDDLAILFAAWAARLCKERSEW